MEVTGSSLNRSCSYCSKSYLGKVFTHCPQITAGGSTRLEEKFRSHLQDTRGSRTRN